MTDERTAPINVPAARSGRARGAWSSIVLALLLGACSGPGLSSAGRSDAIPSASAVGPAASVAPAASASDSVLLSAADIDRPLEPGSYRIFDPFDVPFSIAFPTEWTLKSLSNGDVSFLNTAVNGGDGAAWVTIDRIDTVYDDPCHGGPITPPVPPTVDATVTALTHMVGFTPGPVTDVVLDGHAGKAVELRNAIDTESAGCKEGLMLPLWKIRGGEPAATNGGSRENLWVLDVDGAPLVIDGTMFSSTPPASREEIESVVQSIRIESTT